MSDEVDPRTSPSYNPAACCGDHCWAYPGLGGSGPCWGDVEVVDEIESGDDWWWIHSCQGHMDERDGGKYRVEGEAL